MSPLIPAIQAVYVRHQNELPTLLHSVHSSPVQVDGSIDHSRLLDLTWVFEFARTRKAVDISFATRSSLVP